MAPACFVTYYSTAMLLLEIGPFRILTDPVLDPVGTSYDHGPIHLEKTGGPLLKAEDLLPLDAILLSHEQHADNLDHAGRALLPLAGKVITTLESAAVLQGNAIGLSPWESVTIKSAPPGGDEMILTVTALPAQHGPDGTLEATGVVTGFLLEWTGQQFGPVYLSGDTVPHAGTEEIIRRIQVGTAVLHLGCVQLPVMPGMHFTMSAEEACDYARRLGARQVIPLHYEHWGHFTEGKQQAQAVFDSEPAFGQILWLASGQRTPILF